MPSSATVRDPTAPAPTRTGDARRPVPALHPSFIYVTAVASVAAAIGLRWLFDPWLEGAQVFTLLYAAVAFSVWSGGWRPAVLAAVLGYVTCDFLFTPTRGQWLFQVSWQRGAVSALAYAVTIGVIIVFGEAMRRAQGRAQASERWLAAFLDRLPVGVGFLDAAGRWEIRNAAMGAWSGGTMMPSEDPRAVPRWHATRADGTPLPPEDWPVELALRGETVSPGVEFLLTPETGEPLWTRVSAAPFHDATGTVTGAVVVVEDVTAQRRAEAEIAELTATLRGRIEEMEQLMAVSPVGIFVAHDAACREITANPAGAAMLGCPAVENVSLTGPHSERLSFQVEKDGVVIAGDELPMQRAARLGTAVTGEECDVVYADGRRLTLYEYAVPLFDEERKVRGCLGVFVDISARRRAEVELRAAKEQTEAASRAKDRFLAVLSHELRTPLTPVLLALTELLRAPDVPGEMRDDLEMMRRNLELEARLIDDLLDLNRVASGKITLAREAVDVNAAVRRAADICRGREEERGVSLEMMLDPAAGAVLADPARLQQVLWNVVRNAIKFSRGSGRVVLSTRRLSPERCAVQVLDEGIGITAEALPHLFDAFEQGGEGVTREFGGLGLGLAISKALAELHGGTIRAESAGPGLGAVFSIELPVAPAALALPASNGAAAHSAPPALPRLLLVEDHRDTAETLARLLRRRGYAVTIAHDVTSALATATREPWDVLVSDLGLPDAPGHELIRRLRAERPVRGIAMSGFGMEEDVRRSHEAGFAEHLVKPVEMPRLEEAIRRVMRAPGAESSDAGSAPISVGAA